MLLEEHRSRRGMVDRMLGMRRAESEVVSYFYLILPIYFVDLMEDRIVCVPGSKLKCDARIVRKSFSVEVTMKAFNRSMYVSIDKSCIRLSSKSLVEVNQTP